MNTKFFLRSIAYGFSNLKFACWKIVPVFFIPRRLLSSPQKFSEILQDGADGWLPMVRPVGLSSAAASMVAAAAAAAATADSTVDATEGRQRALQHPVMGRIQQHLSATPKRLLRPSFDGFLGGSNKV